MGSEQVEVHLLSLALVSYKDDCLAFLDLHETYDFISVCKIHASDAVGYPSHDPDIVYAEAQALAVLGHDHGLVARIDKQALDKRIALIKDNCPDSVLTGIDEVVELDLLHYAEACGHQDALVFIEVLEVDYCRDALAILHLRQHCLDVHALSDFLSFGQLPDLQAVGLSEVGDEQDVVV